VYAIIALLFAVAFALYTSAAAKSKGYDEFSWGLGGFFLGPIALIAACGLSDRTLVRAIRSLSVRDIASTSDFAIGEDGANIKTSSAIDWRQDLEGCISYLVESGRVSSGADIDQGSSFIGANAMILRSKSRVVIAEFHKGRNGEWKIL
jgi:hypothetical protein